MWVERQLLGYRVRRRGRVGFANNALGVNCTGNLQKYVLGGLSGHKKAIGNSREEKFHRRNSLPTAETPSQWVNNDYRLHWQVKGKRSSQGRPTIVCCPDIANH